MMTQVIAQRMDGRPAAAPGGISKVPIRTQGEIEAAIRELTSRFAREYVGRGPRDIHVHLIGDLLVIRLQAVLTAPEQHLANSLPAEKGRNLLKQVRTQLIETARPVMEAMIQELTGVEVLSLHHDISTVTGEEVVLFTLAESPDYGNRRNDRCDFRKEKRHATLGGDILDRGPDRRLLRLLGAGRSGNVDREGVVCLVPHSVRGVARLRASRPTQWLGELHENAQESWHNPDGRVAHTVWDFDCSIPQV
jgi:uncharacterized protein YbcI